MCFLRGDDAGEPNCVLIFKLRTFPAQRLGHNLLMARNEYR